MLCLSLKEGSYFTVNGDIVVKIERMERSRVHVAIDAPREIPILRGEVLEREVAKRTAQ